ncbi:MAG: coiled-coil domain-containing protein [Planctomycetota bacterium]|jgi:hypothetical protein
MADNVVNTIFRFVADRQANRRLLQEMDKVDKAYDDQRKAAEKTAQAVSDLEEAQAKQAREARKASEASVRAAKEQSELVGDVASRTSQLSGAVAGLGAVGGQRLMIAADILDAAEAARLLQAEFPAMISQLAGARSQILLFGGIGAAFGGAMLALNEYNKRKKEEKRLLEETRQGVRDYVNELIEFNTFLVDASQEQIQERITTEQKALDGLIATRGDIQSEFDDMLAQLVADYGEFFPELADLDIEDPDFDVSTVEDLVSAMGIANMMTAEQTEDLKLQTTALGELGEQYDDINEKIDDQSEALERLGANILPTAQVLNKTSDVMFDAGSAGRLVTNTLSNMTGGLIDGAAAMSKVGEVSERALSEVADKREEENDALAETIELESQRVDVIGQGAAVIAKAEQQRLDVIEEAAREIAEVERETANKRTEITAKTERDISDLAKDFTQKRIDDETEHQERIASLTDEFNRDNQRALEDFQRDQRRAQEDHRDSLLDAAGRLDAVAILNEQRGFSQSQKRAKEDFKTEQKQRKEDFKIRLRDENDAFKRERQQAQRAYRERERDLRDNLSRQLRDLNIAQSQEMARIRSHQIRRITEIDRALENELRALTGYTQAELMIRDEHYTQMLEQLQAFVSEANATADQLVTPGTTGGGEGGGIVGAVGQFPAQIGGMAPASIGPAALASPMAMQAPVNQFNGMDRLTPGQIRNVVRIVNDEMARALA